MRRSTFLGAAGLVMASAAVVFIGGLSGDAAAAEAATAWDVGHKSKARLIVGKVSDPSKGAVLVAGVEIELEEGWKTYWRNPGDAGGVPPYFDWSKSKNLKHAKVEFPVPKRYKDPTGTTLGYKHHVILPVVLTPADPNQPVGVAVIAEFGVCKEICIPARAKLALEVDPRKVGAPPSALASALAAVPKPVSGAEARLPFLKDVKLETGAKPRLLLDVAYPAGLAGADLFVEASDDVYLPMAKRVGETGKTVHYSIDLSDGVDLKALPGRDLRLTMVSVGGNSEETAKVR